MRSVITYIILAGIIIGCSTSSKTDIQPIKIRKFKEWKAARFHEKVELKIGWYPYEKGNSEKVTSEEWAVSFKDSSGSIDGYMPVIIVDHPSGIDSLFLDMSIDDALLGKLIKHTLMTQIPISRPFRDYLAQADCSICHPQEVIINR